MKWSMDTHKYISEITRQALQIIVAHNLKSSSEPEEIEIVERELAESGVYRDFESARGRVRRALFTYFKAYGCMDENENLTEVGRAFSSGLLSIQEFSFYYILNYHYTYDRYEYYPAQLILVFLTKLKMHTIDQCYLTPYDFSKLVECNSVNEIDEEFVKNQLKMRTGKPIEVQERTIGYDVWAKMLVQAGILKRNSERNLVIVNDNLVDWILTAYKKNYHIDKGTIYTGVLLDIPILHVTNSLANIEPFKDEGAALQAYLFDGIDSSIINKFILKNKKYEFNDVVSKLGISNSIGNYYNTFIGFEKLIAICLINNENPNVQNIGHILSSTDIVRCDIADDENVDENQNKLRFRTGYLSDFERNRIIFGAPGTGKSYQLNADCEKLLKNTNGTYERVTFHPDYSYSHFVGTYKPVTDSNTSEIKYEFVPGPFLRVYIDAIKSSRETISQPYLLLIEEINRAKVAAVFGDVFQLLDRDEDYVSVYDIQASEDIRKYLAYKLGGSPDNYKKIRIPDNMFIWATMNSADQGVFPMDTAFKRRWSFEYLGINDNDKSIKGKFTSNGDEIEWNKLRKAINEKLAIDYKINEDKLMGPYFLSKKVIKTVSETDNSILDQDKFIKAFKSKVIMYLYEDAAKQNKNKLFSGCDSSKYSSVCEAFDKIGIRIFGDGFKEIYDRQKE